MANWPSAKLMGSCGVQKMRSAWDGRNKVGDERGRGGVGIGWRLGEWGRGGAGGRDGAQTWLIRQKVVLIPIMIMDETSRPKGYTKRCVLPGADVLSLKDLESLGIFYNLMPTENRIAWEEVQAKLSPSRDKCKKTKGRPIITHGIYNIISKRRQTFKAKNRGETIFD